MQAAKETVALQRFALVALARHVNAARERLDAARAVEAAARERVDQTADQIQTIKDEIVHLAAAAYRNHTGNRELGAISALSTTNASALVTRADLCTRRRFGSSVPRVESLAVLERRLESERRTAESARVEAEASSGGAGRPPREPDAGV